MKTFYNLMGIDELGPYAVPRAQVKGPDNRTYYAPKPLPASKYMPHQGKREIARRLRKLQHV